MKKTNQADNALLQVKSLETAFKIDGDFYNAVDKVSFQVKKGKVLGIVGESGSGKSVTSLSIMHLLPQTNGKIRNGEIIFDGSRIDHLTEKEMNKIRGKEIAMIFQEPMTSLNPVFTIGYQLQEVLLNHTNLTKVEARKESVQLLKNVGISRPETLIDEYPHQLSGGMRQRVMIAIAIACKPKLLIADEPTTALDVTVQAQILELLKEIQEKTGMAIMLITHDLGVVAEMCDEVIVMYAGQVVEKTSVDALFYNPKHPYTKLLLDSMPKLDMEQEELPSIEGIVPSLKNMPQVGCRFADRCPLAKPECYTMSPVLAEVEKGHEVACLLYETSGAENEVVRS